MTTSAVSFTTRLRTWLFVAGLTALLIAAGALVGGAFLYVFVALAVLLNLGGYWFSDRIALKVSRARPLAESEAPGLFDAMEELSRRAGIPRPRLYLVPSEQPNAFATGRSPARSVVAASSG
jgi:heat shock protein HtpX